MTGALLGTSLNNPLIQWLKLNSALSYEGFIIYGCMLLYGPTPSIAGLFLNFKSRRRGKTYFSMNYTQRLSFINCVSLGNIFWYTFWLFDPRIQKIQDGNEFHDGIF